MCSFKQALSEDTPLQIPGVVNAYCAMMAEQAGFKALYLSGGGVANISYGLPDLGITTLDNVLEDARRITAVTDLPLLVDIDTGFGGAFSIARTIKEMQRAGVAAVHIEDQVAEKRCGHRPGKALVSTAEMCDRVKAAVDARTDEGFTIMARTDAFQLEGIEGAIARSKAYVEAGADMIFAEALPSIDLYPAFCEAVGVPVLANMTEFGKTPLYGASALGDAGVSMVLYPRTIERAMSKAAWAMMNELREHGTQEAALSKMQTRDELYTHLNYLAYEEKLDRLFKEKKHD
ncbi:MAG: methylisocitrate lyase [Gammaproteobacteria bacterium CG11_big_fil_rev_8_21_14_0_20_46_22]|nr:MAG: methylisocitrate lyase [Gammaproteobacteria bacterium CG12_big_fil_rev_8_21_14_0_65_46_12]PIR12182.1 MAG: methylisocitrate lyase [Gammaproteobacteria bacterium CG11_big_fil_rev_8_21_14_0_20_46_22]